MITVSNRAFHRFSEDASTASSAMALFPLRLLVPKLTFHLHCFTDFPEKRLYKSERRIDRIVADT